MKLPEFGVKRPVMTLMIFLGILLLGTVSLKLLPIDLMPKIELPSLAVITQYPGASAADIETTITKVIESRVATVSHISEVISTSEENVSVVTMKFEWGTNLDEVSNEIRQRMDFAKRYLPEDAVDPMLIKFDMSMFPVLIFGITADASYSELYYLIDKKLGNPLKRLPGVASTMILGGKQREIQVNIDRQRLEAFHLSIDQVSGLLAAENLTLPAGSIKMGRIQYILRVPGEFKTLDEIRDVVIGGFRGISVRLKDIAEIEDSFKDIDNRVRINRKQGLMVMVQKQSDANTVDVSNEVRKALPDILAKLPEDIQVLIAMDTSDYIKRSITNLAMTVGWALLFVIMIVFVFLREIRGSFIVAVTIPMSLIIAFIFLFIRGYTINMMSLSAIAIAIGMVVDNAIVIYENTYRHRADMGESRPLAAVFGASEVGLAVTASTITTIAIFFPIMFVPGITGIIFKELALVIIVVLLASLFSALTLTPMLSSKIMRLPKTDKSGKKAMKGFRSASEKWFNKLEKNYTSILGWALSHRKTVAAISIGIFVTSLLMIRFVGSEFMPAMDRSQFMGSVELPAGTRIEVTDKIMDQIEGIVEKEVPETELLFARSGVSESGMSSMMGGFRSDTNTIMIGGRLVPKNKRKRSDLEILNAVGKKVAEIPGIQTQDFSPMDSMAMMAGGTKPITIEIYGEDLEKTDLFALNIEKILKNIQGVIDVTISRGEGKPELWIEIDRKKASALGLNMAQISNTLRAKFYGRVATKYREGGDEFDTFVRLMETDRQSLENVYDVTVVSPAGKLIPLRSIATIVEKKGPLTLERKNQERIVYVGGGLYQRPLGAVIKDLKKNLSEVKVPDGIDFKIAGTAKDQEESFQYLFMALILGIILVYMVLAAQFESLLDPFIIMFSVPFAITGVIWALLITGNTLNLVSYIGMIMLVGIVVNNAIVLVDYINILRARGLDLRKAILLSGQRRLRPVLMTTLTTVFALIPLTLGRGEGAEMWGPLAIAVIGGLLVSTLVTLVFVPTLYSILEERIKKNNKKI